MTHRAPLMHDLGGGLAPAWVFDHFREADLKFKQKKGFFGQRKVKFLGHVISTDGVQPDPAKIEGIKEYLVCLKVKDVCAFLGLANYYRKIC